MRGSDFIFDSVQLMHYKCHKVDFKRSGSYIDSLDWIKKERATINPKNSDDKCFQYAATAALNYEEIKRNPERVSNIKLFTNKNIWEGISYPSKIDNWKTFEKNNLTITLSVLYIKEKEIHVAYISKHNSTLEKQIFILMIPNEEKKGRKAKAKEQWHYLTVKKLSTFLREITSSHHGDFYCLNCIYSFKTKNELNSHEEVRENKDFCGISMPSEKNNMLEFNQNMKSDKMPYIIHAYVESLIEKNR